MMKIAVAGASGRMGRMLIEAVMAADDAQLSGALDVRGSPMLGRDAADFLGRSTGVRITDDLDAGLAGADTLIAVIGTTGFDAAGKAAIAEPRATSRWCSRRTWRSGSTPCSGCSSGGAHPVRRLRRRGHRGASPLQGGRAVGHCAAHGRGRRPRTRPQPRECAIYGREGHTGERKSETIGFSTIRGGDVVGDHTVLFAGIGERIEITHKSGSRMPYALGSMRAARFLAGRSDGLFDMQDVLGLR
jgi:4-hydroxy-tetrahydrodipicolinate reductase